MPNTPYIRHLKKTLRFWKRPAPPPPPPPYLGKVLIHHGHQVLLVGVAHGQAAVTQGCRIATQPHVTESLPAECGDCGLPAHLQGGRGRWGGIMNQPLPNTAAIVTPTHTKVPHTYPHTYFHTPVLRSIAVSRVQPAPRGDTPRVVPRLLPPPPSCPPPRPPQRRRGDPPRRLRPDPQGHAGSGAEPAPRHACLCGVCRAKCESR